MSEFNSKRTAICRLQTDLTRHIYELFIPIRDPNLPKAQLSNLEEYACAIWLGGQIPSLYVLQLQPKQVLRWLSPWRYYMGGGSRSLGNTRDVKWHHEWQPTTMNTANQHSRHWILYDVWPTKESVGDVHKDQLPQNENVQQRQVELPSFYK
jgi:hypothetical protein